MNSSYLPRPNSKPTTNGTLGRQRYVDFHLELCWQRHEDSSHSACPLHAFLRASSLPSLSMETCNLEDITKHKSIFSKSTLKQVLKISQIYRWQAFCESIAQLWAFSKQGPNHGMEYCKSLSITLKMSKGNNSSSTR